MNLNCVCYLKCCNLWKIYNLWFIFFVDGYVTWGEGLRRCGKSCRLRWLNYLSPNVKHGDFSEEEEDLIIRLHKLLGNRFVLFLLCSSKVNKLQVYCVALQSKISCLPINNAVQVVSDRRAGAGTNR